MTWSERENQTLRPRMRRAAGFGALLVLVGIVCAVPVGLIAVGALPHGAFLIRVVRHLRWPPWGSHQATGGIQASASPMSFAASCAEFVATSFAWMAWCWMLVCLALDLRARRRGTEAAHLPASRTMQAVAACLVGASLAFLAAGRGHGVPQVRVQVHHAVLGERLASALPVIDDPGDLLLGATPVVGTRTGDMPRGLVGQTRGTRLADGTGEIAHVPDDGVGRLRIASDAARGWGIEIDDEATPGGMDARDPVPRELVEPSALVGAASTSAPAITAADHGDEVTAHLVGPRETLWSIAAQELGSPRRWRELAEHNYGRVQADGGRLERDHFLRPGWVLQLPPAGQMEPPGRPRATDQQWRDPGSVFEELDGHRTRLQVSARSMHPAAMVASADAPSPGQRPSPVQWAPEAGVHDLLGIGFVGTIDRLRRAQQRHRPLHATLRLPDLRWSGIERRFRAGMDPWFVSDVEDVFRRIGTASTVGRIPDISSLLVSDDAIEVDLVGEVDRTSLEVVGEVVDVVPGSAGRLRVRRQAHAKRGVQHADLRPGRIPCPALVTAQVERAGTTMQLVNLESGGPYRVTGSWKERSESISFVALELCMSPWGRQLEVNLIGHEGSFPPALPVSVGTDPEELIAAAHLRRLHLRRLADEHGWRTLHSARRASADPLWNTTVVLCGPAVAADVEAELCELASDHCSGLAVVTAGTGVEHRQLQMDLSYAELSLPVRNRAVLDAIEGLIDGVSEHAFVDLAEGHQRVDRGPHVAHASGWRSTSPGLGGRGIGARQVDLDDAQMAHIAQIEVRVLGPVEIAGSARPFSRAWARELVVYLAMHPTGVANEIWSTALWPDRLLAPSSLHSTASVARRALGTDVDGNDHLPRGHGRLQMGPYVSTDWTRLDALAGSDDPARWREALELVRGRPFDGLKATDWLILEGVGPAVEARVVDVATSFAEWCLDAGDPAGAAWSARRGLLASPYDERLYRVLMRAADAAGNPAGVEAVMTELVRLVADDVEPFDSVHPETLDLYRSLSRRRTLAVR